MIQIIGSRKSGRTTELIKLCKKMNEEHGINDTFIVVSNMNRARCVYEEAVKMGYLEMPYPVPASYVNHKTKTFYKYALVDDAEAVLQTLLGGFVYLEGYVVQGPERIENGCRVGWHSVQEVRS